MLSILFTALTAILCAIGLNELEEKYPNGLVVTCISTGASIIDIPIWISAQNENKGWTAE